MAEHKKIWNQHLLNKFSNQTKNVDLEQKTFHTLKIALGGEGTK